MYENFNRFNRIYVKDKNNLENVKKIAITEVERNKVTLLMENNEVPNSYYGSADVFKKVFDLINNVY